MSENSTFGKINAGYEEWAREPQRSVSKKIEFGTWWRLNSTYWRVTWLETTGELFAAERKPSDRFVVLSRLEKKQVNDLMHKWFDGDNLHVLLLRFNHDPAGEPQ